MNSTLTSEFYVAAPAEDLWDVIGSKDAYKTIQMLVPGMFEKLEILEGDGGTGTVLVVVFSPGMLTMAKAAAKYVVDNSKKSPNYSYIDNADKYEL
ncbi:hypothetical protein MKW98_020853 [Papaver atlanticum]|uniref:Uncharacterized protein n=1 Tax=Papaver atlanticum TaxID=357466 RepID=A0AAD4TD71_9MAGN|nr:hypothetical protein MKW98_020853 [Papaver atlanticum]